MARILAIEPEPELRVTLRRLVRDNLDAEVAVVASTDDAIDALAEAAPDLILTSTLLSPLDDERLTIYLRYAPNLDHVPVLTIPPLVEISNDTGKQPGGFWARLVNLLKRRRDRTWATYDFSAIAVRIEQALAQARADAAELAFARPARMVLLATRRPLLLGSGAAPQAFEAGGPLVVSPGVPMLYHDPRVLDEEWEAIRLGMDLEPPMESAPSHWQTRSRRWNRTELPWLTRVALSWGAELRLVNLSSSGLLVESGVRFTLGNLTDFQLVGPANDMIVKARVVRTDVAPGTSPGMKYVTAAVFEKPFNMQGLERSLADLAEPTGASWRVA